MGDRSASQVTVIGADETPDDEPRPETRRSGRWIGLGLIGVALIGLVALSGSEVAERLPDDDAELTSPIVDLAPEVDDPPLVIQRGGLTSPALVFEHVADLEGAVTAVHRLDSGRVLVAVQTGAGESPQTALVATDDGQQWDVLAELPPGDSVTTLTSTEDVIVAGGHSIGPGPRLGWYGQTQGRAAIWTSLDGGASWTRSTVNDPGGTAHTVLGVQQLLASNGRVFLSGYRESSLSATIVERIPAEVIDLVGRPWFYLDAVWVDPPRLELTFMGTTLWRATADELGLDPVDVPDPAGYENNHALLVSDDLLAWEEMEIDGVAWIESLTTDGEGSLLISAYRERGPVLLTSTEGAQFEEQEVFGLNDLRFVRHWNDLTIAGTSSYVSAFDGRYWRAISPEDAIPRLTGATSWDVAGIDVIADALIAVAMGLDWENLVTDEADFEARFLSNEGHEVILDLNYGSLAVETEDERVALGLYSGGQPLTLDPETGLISVSSQGELIATFPVDRLVDAIRVTPYGPQRVETRARVLFTTDRRRWHMGEIDLGRRVGWWPPTVTITGDRILLLDGVGDTFDPFTGRIAGSNVVTRIYAAPRP